MDLFQVQRIILDMLNHLETHHKIIGIVSQRCQRRKIHAYEFSTWESLLKCVNGLLDLVYGGKTGCTLKQGGNPSSLAAADLKDLTPNVIGCYNICLEQPLMDGII